MIIRDFVREKTSEERFDIVGSLFIWILILLVLCVLPLFLKNKYDHIASGKYEMLFEIGRWTGIVMGLFASGYYAGRGLSRRELKAFKNIAKTDIAVLLYTVVTAVSYFLSDYKFMGIEEDIHTEGAFWGVSGWYLGLITYLIFILFYLVSSRFFLYTDKFLIPVLAVAEFIFLWGMLNRFRVSVFKFDGNDPKFIATLGNINWFCGYACIMVPLMMGLYWYRGEKSRPMYGMLLFTGFMTMIINGSDSGVLALYLTMLFLFVCSLKTREGAVRFSEIALIFASADLIVAILTGIFRHFLSFEGMLTEVLTDLRVSLFIMILCLSFFFYLRYLDSRGKIYPVFFRDSLGKIACILTVTLFAGVILLIVINTKTGGKVPIIGKSEFFMFNREWGTLRGTDWEVAIRLFARQSPLKKLIGSGPDTFWFLASDHLDILEIIKEGFHKIRLTNAHCEILTILVNQGILGLLSYIGISVTLFVTLKKKLKENPEFMMFLLMIIMYHSNNLISFEQITSTPFFYLVSGIAAAAVVRREIPSVDKQIGRSYNSDT